MIRRILTLFILPLSLSAQAGIDSLIPSATPFVTDAAHLFSPEQIAQMNDIARNTQSTLKGDIAVLTLPSLHNYLPVEVATAAGRRWGVGGKAEIGSAQRNLGVVILIVPRTPEHKGSCFIATGNGAEGFITDGTAGALCRSETEKFRAEQYGAATLDLVNLVANLMKNHVHPPPSPPPVEIPWGGIFIVMGIVLTGFIIIGYVDRKNDEKRRAEEARQWERMKAARERADKEYRRRQEELNRLAAIRRKQEEAAEKARWEALSPEEQQAELAHKASLAKEAERKRKEREAAEALARKKRREEEEEDDRRRRNSSSYDYGSSSSSSDYGSSSSGGSDSFGGGGGLSGGGGGSDF